MRVVDTSAWIEWFLGSAAGDRVGSELPAAQNWIVPTIVQLELAKWMTREVGEDAADRAIALSGTFQVVPLDTGIALAAAELSVANRLATADAIVYATALSREADLLTCDAHFRGLDRVVLVEKAENARR
jgi:predicted nucleic acid-binding protein